MKTVRIGVVTLAVAFVPNTFGIGISLSVLDSSVGESSSYGSLVIGPFWLHLGLIGPDGWSGWMAGAWGRQRHRFLRRVDAGYLREVNSLSGEARRLATEIEASLLAKH